MHRALCALIAAFALGVGRRSRRLRAHDPRGDGAKRSAVLLANARVSLRVLHHYAADGVRTPQGADPIDSRVTILDVMAILWRPSISGP